MPAVGAMDVDIPSPTALDFLSDGYYSLDPRGCHEILHSLVTDYDVPCVQVCDLIRQYMSLSATREGGEEHPGARRRTAAPHRRCTSWSTASVRRSGPRMPGSVRPWMRSPVGSSSSRSSALTSSPCWGMRVLRCCMSWMGT